MGPRSQLDWLGVVSLWVGAILLAIKAAGVPLVTGAPSFLAAVFWNYVPLALITLALGIFLYRQLWPAKETAAEAVGPAAVARPRADRSAEELAALLDTARLNARRAMADNGTERTAELALPALRAALLTAQKDKGIALPKESGRARLDLEAGCRIIERIAPLLRLGHDEEARNAATELADRLSQARE